MDTRFTLSWRSVPRPRWVRPAVVAEDSEVEVETVGVEEAGSAVVEDAVETEKVVVVAADPATGRAGMFGF